MQSKLLTPTETIERKDLVVALAISDVRGEDELMHAVALVQTLRPGESITRGWNLKRDKVVNRIVTIVEQEITGLCTDCVVPDDLRSADQGRQFVIDGQIVRVPNSSYIIIGPRNTDD